MSGKNTAEGFACQITCNQAFFKKECLITGQLPKEKSFISRRPKNRNHFCNGLIVCLCLTRRPYGPSTDCDLATTFFVRDQTDTPDPLGQTWSSTISEMFCEKGLSKGRMPHFYRRYIYDMLTIVTEVLNEMALLETLNYCNPLVRLTLEIRV